MPHLKRHVGLAACGPTTPSIAGTSFHPDRIEQPWLNWLALRTFSDRLWQSIMRSFRQSDEPRIWQRHDREGRVYWDGYDPRSGQSMLSGSAAEMRAWIEALYQIGGTR